MKEGNSKLPKNEPENLLWVHFRKQWTTIESINLGFPSLMIAVVNYCQWWLLIFSYIIWTKAKIELIFNEVCTKLYGRL